MMNAAGQANAVDASPQADGAIDDSKAATPSKARILVVEDDPDISGLLVYTLENAGFLATAAFDSKTAWQSMTLSAPDLVLLDWMLPDISGIDLLRRIREYSGLASVPVIMLTARSEEPDRVRGLESGADDYIVKPFSPRELCARVNSRLRALRCERSRTLASCGLELDPKSHRVSVDGHTVVLGPTEFRLLRHFMNNKERVLTRGMLLDNVWGTNVYIEERTVDVHVRRLRKALEPYHKAMLVQTVRGVGYRFSDHGCSQRGSGDSL